jgi:hypothetical protein
MELQKPTSRFPEGSSADMRQRSPSPPVSAGQSRSQSPRHSSPSAPANANDKDVDENGGDQAAQEVGSPAGYLAYLRKLQQVWQDQPDVCVSWSDLAYVLSLDKQETAVKSIVGTFISALKAPFTFNNSKSRYQLHALRPSSGMLLPGSCTLVLSPPGHGTEGETRKE